jgi:hypothetical protein
VRELASDAPGITSGGLHRGLTTADVSCFRYAVGVVKGLWSQQRADAGAVRAARSQPVSESDQWRELSERT